MSRPIAQRGRFRSLLIVRVVQVLPWQNHLRGTYVFISKQPYNRSRLVYAYLNATGSANTNFRRWGDFGVLFVTEPGSGEAIEGCGLVVVDLRLPLALLLAFC